MKTKKQYDLDGSLAALKNLVISNAFLEADYEFILVLQDPSGAPAGSLRVGWNSEEKLVFTREYVTVRREYLGP